MDVKANGYPVCRTSGCLQNAQYYCVWGCLDQHVFDSAFCLPCMSAVRSKMQESTHYMIRLHCHCGRLFTDFFYSSVTDRTHKLMGTMGIIHDR